MDLPDDGRGPCVSRRSHFILDNDGQLAERYDVNLHRLGEGAFGLVSKAVNKATCAPRAVKCIPKSSGSDAAQPEQEVAILKAMDHPNIVKLYETFEDANNMYLVMELCRGGSLFDRLKKLDRVPEGQAASLVRQVMHGVAYMHQNRICHRDLKPANMLLSSSRKLEQVTLKIIDFGLARRFEEGQVLSTRVGTPCYVAPEVLEGRYDSKCDIWSVGVTAHVMLCSRVPFDGETEQEIIRQVRLGSVSLEPAEWEELSGHSQQLVRSLLHRVPEARPSAAQALQHPWVASKALHPTRSAPLQADLVRKLRRFHALDHLSKAALTVSASNLPEEKVAGIREAFLQLDADGSGVLCEAKIKRGLEKSGLPGLARELSGAGSRALSYTGFLAAMLDSQQHMTEEACWSAFCFFDKSGDGKISVGELRDALSGALGEKAPRDVAVADIMLKIDQNKDGVLDFQEFTALLHDASAP